MDDVKPRVTIEDIAAEAGVSRQTVTRAMNGMRDISPATRERVLEVGARLGYRPNRFAANLSRSRKTKTIAFVVDSFRNPYYSELAADLLDAAAQRDWQMTISSHENVSETELVSRLAQEVDAIVGYFGDPDETALLAAARGVPVVLLERTPVSPALYSVEIDFDAGLQQIVTELRARGSRRFAMLESQAVDTGYAPSGRRKAYESAVDPESAAAVVVCVAPPQSIDAGERGFDELMERFPETDTVIAFSDLMAMGALRSAHRQAVDIPGRVKLVGIDGLSLGAVTSPSLSSVRIVGGDITEAIAKALEAALGANEGDATVHPRIVPSPLWRESA